MGATSVLVIMGIPGAGKTTLSLSLARRLGWGRLSRDDLREYLGLQNHANGKESAWQELLSKLVSALDRQDSVIVDGMPFSKASERTEISRIATQMGANTYFLLAHCPPEVAEKRIAMGGAHGAIDRTPGLAHEVAARFEPVTGVFGEIDATMDLDGCIQAVLDYLDAQMTPPR